MHRRATLKAIVEMIMETMDQCVWCGFTKKRKVKSFMSAAAVRAQSLQRRVKSGHRAKCGDAHKH